MVGSGIKKFAQENGLTLKNGIAYGNYRGYMLSMQEGSGWKSAAFAARLETEEIQNIISGFLANQENTKKYSINSFSVNERGANIVFHDTIGTMKKMIAFIEDFSSVLLNAGVPGVSVCSCCGQPFEYADAINVTINGIAYKMHSGCVDTINNTAELVNEEKQNTGNVATGVIGAFLGGIIGSIPWAVAYYFGWFVGWFGFIIGIAAKKGYEIFKGKESRIKAVAVIVATIISVILVEFITLLIVINASFAADAEIVAMGYTFTDVVLSLVYAIMYDSSVVAAIAKDIILGLVFAALGIYSTAKDIFKKNSPNNGKAIRLD